MTSPSSPRAGEAEGHVKHDDWWCECGSRLEDCDYYMEARAGEAAWQVHNHGPHQGRGTACREYQLNGRLVGACKIVEATSGRVGEAEGGMRPEPIRPEHVIDRRGMVWRVVRDGGMATRADYVGIVSIGIEELRATSGPLLPFDSLAYAATAATEPEPDEEARSIEAARIEDEAVDSAWRAKYFDEPDREATPMTECGHIAVAATDADLAYCHDLLRRPNNEGLAELGWYVAPLLARIEAAASPAGPEAVPQSEREGLLRIALEDWLTWWGEDRPEGWEPEQTDGCRPKECDCGFLALVHQSRLALGRACCGEEEHPRVAALASPAHPDEE